MIAWQDGAAAWRAMGSPIRLVPLGRGDADARALAAAVQADLEASEQAMSRFRPSAELVRLNDRLGAWTQVSTRLYAALASAARAHRLTGGRFDPRVLTRLEAIGYAGAPRKAGTGSPDGPWLEREPRRRRVRLEAPLDLGGIGKGLGVRWAARVAAAGAPSFLLDAGGDLLARGRGPDGRGWRIGVEDPRRPDDLIAALLLPAGGAVCTSSTARHRWQAAGRQVHHLIDPRSGEPGGRGLLAVTVVASDPAWAEVWSKALFLEGADGIAAAATGRAALWVAEDGRVGMTDQAAALVLWLAPAARGPAAPSAPPGLPGPLTTVPEFARVAAWR